MIFWGLISLTFLWFALVVLSLKFPFLNGFFFGFDPDKAMGVDYWSVPRGFLNLLEGRSMFDTFQGVQYGGPNVTWYLSHPLFVLVAGPIFSFLSPMASYGLWVTFSLSLLLLMGHLFAKRAPTAPQKGLCYFLSIFGLPVYSLLFTGNIHTLTVLAIALILIGFYHFSQGASKPGNRYFVAGLLISLFTKPVVILMLPMFLIISETRRSTFLSLGIYALVSLATVLIPFLNPEFIGIERILSLLIDPQYVKENLNIYNNNYVLNSDMKDNTIHWFNLIAQSDFYWNHLQIFSLSAFVNGIFDSQLPPVLFKIPLFGSVLASVLTITLRDQRQRLEVATWIVCLLTLSFFLSYNTVWEYQFTLLIPISLLCVLKASDPMQKGTALWVLLFSLVVTLPSLYFLYGPSIKAQSFALVRANRVLPVLGMFLVIFWRVGVTLVRAGLEHRKGQLTSS